MTPMRVNIDPLPDGQYARWARLYSKAHVLETLATISPATGEGE